MPFDFFNNATEGMRIIESHLFALTSACFLLLLPFFLREYD